MRKYCVMNTENGKIAIVYQAEEQQRVCELWDNDPYTHFRVATDKEDLDFEVMKWDGGFQFDPALNAERETRRWAALRSQRDEYLKDTDWTQVIDFDNGLSESDKTSYANYRTYLRDLPANINDINADYQGTKSYTDWSA